MRTKTMEETVCVHFLLPVTIFNTSRLNLGYVTNLHSTLGLGLAIYETDRQLVRGK